MLRNIVYVPLGFLQLNLGLKCDTVVRWPGLWEVMPRLLQAQDCSPESFWYSWEDCVKRNKANSTFFPVTFFSDSVSLCVSLLSSFTLPSLSLLSLTMQVKALLLHTLLWWHNLLYCYHLRGSNIWSSHSWILTLQRWTNYIFLSIIYTSGIIVKVDWYIWLPMNIHRALVNNSDL